MKTLVTIRFERGDDYYETDYVVDEEAVMESSPYRSAAIEQAYQTGAYERINGWLQNYLMGQIRKELGRE